MPDAKKTSKTSSEPTPTHFAHLKRQRRTVLASCGTPKWLVRRIGGWMGRAVL